MIRRAIGIILILVGLMGLAICYVGVKSGQIAVDSLADSLDSALESASETLDTIEETIEQSRQTVDSINATVEQVQTTTEDLSTTIDDTQPILGELALLVGEAIPSTISDVQDTIPNIAQTAKVVDDTLRLLSKLQIEETVPIINYKISLGLGVDYDPEVAFDQAIEGVGDGLEPIAQASGNLESDLNTAGVNMEVLSQDLDELSARLGEMNSELAAFRPLLDEYSSLVVEMQNDISDGQKRLRDQVATAKQALLLVAIWLGLFQLLPIYFGLELALGNRLVRPAELAQPNAHAETKPIPENSPAVATIEQENGPDRTAEMVDQEGDAGIEESQS
jgi:ABC-type transporter Mla subunit MlaD